MTDRTPNRSRATAEGTGLLARVTKNGALVVASIVFALVLVEAAFRILGLYSPVSFHRMPPNSVSRDAQTAWDLTYRTNSLGFRDGEHSYRRGAAPRIVVVGDSFTFGQGVEPGSAFPVILQQLLEASGRRSEVINVSKIGIGPESYYVLVKEIGLACQPDVIVVNVFGNDASDAAVEGLSRRIVRGLSHTLHLFTFVRITNQKLADRRTATVTEDVEELWRRLAARCAQHRPPVRCEEFVREFRARHGSKLNNLATSVFTDPDEVRRWVYTDPSLQGWKDFERYIRSIAALCREHGVRLVIGIVPDGVQVDPGQLELRRSMGMDYPDSVLTDAGPFQSRVAGLARSLGVEVYDPLSLFRSRREGLYFESDAHWTPEGHRLYARGLADFLDDELSRPPTSAAR